MPFIFSQIESNSVALKEYIEKSCPLVIAFPPYIDMSFTYCFKHFIYEDVHFLQM